MELPKTRGPHLCDDRTSFYKSTKETPALAGTFYTTTLCNVQSLPVLFGQRGRANASSSRRGRTSNFAWPMRCAAKRKDPLGPAREGARAAVVARAPPWSGQGPRLDDRIIPHSVLETTHWASVKHSLRRWQERAGGAGAASSHRHMKPWADKASKAFG